MSFASTLSREEFVGWLGGTYRPSTRSMRGIDLPAFKLEDVAVWWRTSAESETREAGTIVVNDAAIPSFLAFTATYVRSYVPFTAFFRVLPLSLFPRFIELTSTADVAAVPSELVGTMIAEASLQVGERARSIDDLSIQSCRATFSSAVIQALGVGYDSSMIALLAKNWGRAHAVLSGESLRQPLNSIEEFWSTLAPAIRPNKERFEPPTAISSFLKGILSRQDLPQSAWQNLVKDIPELGDAPRDMQGSREDRVRNFDRYVKLLASADKIDTRIRNMATGLLMAAVAHGSFKYLRLLGPYEDRLSTARLWFAFFASLHPSTDVFHEGDCLGRQLTRQLQQEPVLTSPSADISIDELFILMSERQAPPRFRTEYGTIITVELLPGVNARFRQLREGERPANTSKRPATETREIRALLDRALSLMDRIDGGRPEAQADLFKPSKGKGSKGRQER